MRRSPTVLHIEAGRHLYGGARQVLYLLEGLAAAGLRNVLVCPAGSGIDEAAANHCARVHAVPLRGDLDIGMARRLRRVIDAEAPDVVHVHSRRGADLWGGWAARRAAVPAVLSRRVDNPEARLVVRLKYSLYAKVIAISEGIREVLLREGLTPGKVVCVQSAVDPTPYRAGCQREWFAAEFSVPPGAPILGVVAQLIERKGHVYLLDALPAILRRHPEVRVFLFGRGPMEAELKARIHREGLDSVVRLAGFRSDLERVLPCLDMLVHPATLEGLGVSLLQASAAGVPIVAARAGGIPEAVRDGQNGLLVAPRDRAALADAILRLLDDPNEARAMGQRGQTLVAREFSVSRMVAGNLRVYEELLGGPLHRGSEQA